jgi:nicotinate phosphoribosyltransferase
VYKLHYVNRTLLTDLYQLTMACGYWKHGLHEREAVFHLSFRKPPFGGGYTIAAGLASAIDYLSSLQFDEEALAYLASIRSESGGRLFEDAFLDHLRQLRFTCDVDAVPEGTLVFPHEPLVRVRGPLLQAQLVETTLLNAINFESLIATKAARVVEAAAGRPVLEFGLRRAQGPDGALTASRAAYLGGCAATSNVLAGQRYGIPVRGTHAHSWVMAFDDEQASFDAWADAMPENALLLVDTYDTLDGVRHAIATGERLRARGKKLAGIRLDSGDLAWLANEARRLLDAAGFTEAKVVATNDLDEEIIASLVQQGARIDTFAVGTKLVTAYDQPALGGVYKLGAIRDESGQWSHRIKLSEQAVKTSIPGMLNVRRFTRDGEPLADMIWDELDGAPDKPLIFDPADPTRQKTLGGCESADLLLPVFRAGSLAYASPSLAETREHAARELQALHPSRRRLRNPHSYPVGLETRLNERRLAMIRAARENR